MYIQSQDPTSDSQAFHELYAPSNSVEVQLDPPFLSSSLDPTWTESAYQLRSGFSQGIRVDTSATQRLPMQSSYPSDSTSTPQWPMHANFSPSSASEMPPESSSNYSALSLSPDSSFSYYNSDNNLYANHQLSAFNRQDRSPSTEELVHSSGYSSSVHLSSPSTPSSQHNTTRGESSPGQSPLMQFSSQQEVSIALVPALTIIMLMLSGTSVTDRELQLQCYWQTSGALHTQTAVTILPGSSTPTNIWFLWVIHPPDDVQATHE